MVIDIFILIGNHVSSITSLIHAQSCIIPLTALPLFSLVLTPAHGPRPRLLRTLRTTNIIHPQQQTRTLYRRLDTLQFNRLRFPHPITLHIDNRARIAINPPRALPLRVLRSQLR